MRRRLLAGALAVLLTAALAGAGAAATVRRASVATAWDDERVLTVLVLGSDMGPPNRPGNPLRGRADGIHLVAVDTKRRRVTIVDIPRDSYIAGAKVNDHMVRGGPRRTATVLQDYSGVKIDYWAVTTFKGLRDIVDAMGGVGVSLPKPMRDAGSGANFRAGRQRFTGREALSYTRNRYGLPDGDFGRTRNQGKLLRFAHREVRRSADDLPSLVRLVGAFSRNTESNIPPRQLLRLATLARQIKPRDVKQVSLKGGVGMVGGASVVHLSPGDAFRDIKRRRIGR